MLVEETAIGDRFRFMVVSAALPFGSLAVITGKARRLIKTKDGKFRRPLNLFKEGFIYLNMHLLDQDEFPSLNFIQNQRLC